MTDPISAALKTISDGALQSDQAIVDALGKVVTLNLQLVDRVLKLERTLKDVTNQITAILEETVDHATEQNRWNAVTHERVKFLEEIIKRAAAMEKAAQKTH